MGCRRGVGRTPPGPCTVRRVPQSLQRSSGERGARLCRGRRPRHPPARPAAVVPSLVPNAAGAVPGRLRISAAWAGLSVSKEQPDACESSPFGPAPLPLSVWKPLQPQTGTGKVPDGFPLHLAVQCFTLLVHISIK